MRLGEALSLPVFVIVGNYHYDSGKALLGTASVDKALRCIQENLEDYDDVDCTIFKNGEEIGFNVFDKGINLTPNQDKARIEREFEFMVAKAGLTY